MVRVGITFQPERRYLDLLEPLFARADYLEVAPETLWLPADHGDATPNAFHDELRERVARTGIPVVAHGVGLSLGTADPADAARQEAWLQRIRRDHQVFRFAWYTDHLGASILAGHAVTLPIALPMTDAMAAVVRTRLQQLQRVVPDVGFENSVFYFTLGRWLDEPAFFAKTLSAPRTHLLLDLHNVHTMAHNTGGDPWAYLDRIQLDTVIEIHLSGGADSEPGWLPEGRTMRLDSHDHAIPEPVWALFERTAPRCPNLRGVTIERMEGTVDEPDVAVLRDEMQRAREVVRGLR